MGFVDLYAAETSVTSEDAWLDVVDERCVSALQALLPPGVAWPRDADAELTALIRALSYEYSRVKRRGRTLLEELDPRTTFELLEDWERVYGLPDCTSPTTLAGRRSALHGKMLGHGDPTLAYFVGIVESLGYHDPEVVEYDGDDMFTAVSPCTDPLYTETWRFVWDVFTTSLGDETDAALVCTIEGLAPLHTLPRFFISAWSLSPTTTVAQAFGLAQRSGLWVLVGIDSGGGAYIGTSINDGLDWTERVCPKNFPLYSVAYGNGLWVAVGSADGGDALIVTSTDGVTWTEQVNPKNLSLYSVAYGNGLWVAVGDNDGADAYVVTSTDGVTWTERANPKNVILRGVAHNGDALWVAVGNDDGADAYVVTSPDGAVWTERANPLNVRFVAVAYGGGVWTAVGWQDGTDAYVATSPNGLAWTERANPKNINLQAVAYDDGLWVAVGFVDVIDADDAYLLRSTDDGVTWTEEANPEYKPLNCVAVVSGLWMAGGGDVGGLYLATSRR